MFIFFQAMSSYICAVVFVVYHVILSSRVCTQYHVVVTTSAARQHILSKQVYTAVTEQRLGKQTCSH
jgi:hypothetical protein